MTLPGACRTRLVQPRARQASQSNKCSVTFPLILLGSCQSRLFFFFCHLYKHGNHTGHAKEASHGHAKGGGTTSANGLDATSGNRCGSDGRLRELGGRGLVHVERPLSRRVDDADHAVGAVPGLRAVEPDGCRGVCDLDRELLGVSPRCCGEVAGEETPGGGRLARARERTARDRVVRGLELEDEPVTLLSRDGVGVEGHVGLGDDGVIGGVAGDGQCRDDNELTE
jgi:hypothetical protein